MTLSSLEELNNVNWRYFKKFKGVYVDKNGVKQEKEGLILLEN